MEFQTYLNKQCNCETGIIVYKNIPCCRWCRKPLIIGAMISYLPEHFADYKTSDIWQRLYPEIQIVDPDGWDRKDFNYFWFIEEITFEEYSKRLIQSTCKGLEHFPLKRKEDKEIPEIKYVLVDGEQVCTCGTKKSKHHYRHPFIPKIL